MDEFKGFTLGSREGAPKVEFDPNESFYPLLKTDAQWDNYHDPVVYETEKAMRAWIAKKVKEPSWVRTQQKRKYTYARLFEEIFHRKWDPKTDSKYTHKMRKVFQHYASSITVKHSGHRATYTVSPRRVDVPPYSLKLRIEWFMERDVMPCWQNMKLAKEITPGHSRNYKTEKNKERMRRIGLERQYARQRNQE